jgi:L-ascorbate metabolism protein UlaG (beta-lactamase superfamily)
VILLTHGHGDHIGDTERIAHRTHPLIISTVELADYFSEKGFRTHGMQPGGGHSFDFGYVKLTQAIHGSALPVNGLPYTFGLASGILLHAEGKTIYHAGDTALFSDMKLIGEDYPIDVAFLPIGDNYTMGPKDAAKAVTFLKPRIAVPIHYNTFPLIEQDPNEFLALLDDGVGLIMQPGESISL